MTVFTLEQTNKLKYGQHRSDLRLSVLVPPTLLSARLNNASIERGALSIAYDGGTGATTYIEEFQEVWVGTSVGRKDVGTLLLRSITGTSVSGTITVYEHALDLKDDMFLSFKLNWNVEGVQPRMIPIGVDGAVSDVLMYKYYDVPYSNQNDKSKLKPILTGCYTRVKSWVSPEVVFDIDFSGSYPMAVDAAIDSYNLSVVPTDGVTITSFDTSTGIGEVTVTEAGTWWLKGTVTDTLGNTKIVRFRIHCDAEGSTIFEKFRLESLNYTWDTFTAAPIATIGLTLTSYGNMATVPLGTEVILWHKNYINDVEDYVDVMGLEPQILFCGMTTEEREANSFKDGTFTLSLQAQGPDGWLDNVPMRAIGIRAKNNPTAWWQFNRYLTVGRAIQHYYEQHSTVFNRLEVLGLDANTLRARAADFEEMSMFSSTNQFCFERGILAKFISDRLGRLRLEQDLQLKNLADREAADIIMTIDEDDVSGEVVVVRRYAMENHTGQLSGFAWAGDESDIGTPYISIIPGYRRYDYSFALQELTGKSLLDKPLQILGSQTDSNQKLGRIHAAANSYIVEVRIPFRGNYATALTVIPSYGWYEIDFTGTFLARELGQDVVKALCRRIDVSYDNKLGILKVEGTFQIEAQGPDAILGNYPTGFPEPPVVETPTEIVEQGLRALLADGSAYFITDEMDDWEQVRTESYNHICTDYWWRIRTGSNNPNQVIWYGVNSSGVFRHEGKDADPIDLTPLQDPPNSWSDSPAPATEDLTFTWIETNPRILGEIATIAVWQNSDGLWRSWIVYSRNNGINWHYEPLTNMTGTLAESLALWGSYLLTGYILITLWGDDGTDGLSLGYAIADDSYNVTESATIGACTYEELGKNLDYYLYVTTVWDDYKVYLFGRADFTNIGATGVHHIVEYNYDTSTWTSIESSLGTKFVVGLRVSKEESGDREFYALLRDPVISGPGAPIVTDTQEPPGSPSHTGSTDWIRLVRYSDTQAYAYLEDPNDGDFDYWLVTFSDGVTVGSLVESAITPTVGFGWNSIPKELSENILFLTIFYNGEYTYSWVPGLTGTREVSLGLYPTPQDVNWGFKSIEYLADAGVNTSGNHSAAWVSANKLYAGGREYGEIYTGITGYIEPAVYQSTIFDTNAYHYDAAAKDDGSYVLDAWRHLDKHISGDTNNWSLTKVSISGTSCTAEYTEDLQALVDQAGFSLGLGDVWQVLKHVSGDVFLIKYRTSRFRLISVGGSAFTAGAEFYFNDYESGANFLDDHVILTSTKMAIVYGATAGATKYLKVGTMTLDLDNLTIAWDANAVNIGSSTSSFWEYPLSMTKLTSTKAGVSWVDPATSKIKFSEINFTG